MPVTPPNVVCTPFFGRTIKGWRVGVRICFTVDPTEVFSANFGNDVAQAQADLNPLINALSDATFLPLGGSALIEAAGYGSGGAVDNAEDSAVFSFQTSTGAIGKVSIPAPKSSIFLGDNQTIDPANAAVTAFTAYMLAPTTAFSNNGIASTKSGAGFTSFIGGVRVRRKTRRKMNIFVKNPQGTSPAI